MKAKNPTKKNPLLDDEPLVKAHSEPDADDMGGEDDGDEDDEDDEDEDEDEDEGYGKSLPNESDILKALDALDVTATLAKSGGSLRKSELAAKVATGEALSKSEREEMRRYLDGDDGDGAEPMSKSHREEWKEDRGIEEAFDVAPFLDAQASAICKSLDGLRASVTETRGETNALVGRLAAGLSAIGGAVVQSQRRIVQLEGLVKSLGGDIAATPNTPKAKTRVGQPFQKSQGGPPQQAPQANGSVLGQDQIRQTLTDLVKSTEGNGAKGFGIVDGVDFTVEEAKFESTRQISPAAMRIVLRHNKIDPTPLGL